MKTTQMNTSWLVVLAHYHQDLQSRFELNGSFYQSGGAIPSSRNIMDYQN